jgi:hypothetical protein
VSPDPHVAVARTRYPLLAAALERHLRWARDFVIVGDVDSAVEAIRDAYATFAELRAADAPGGASAQSSITMSCVIDRDVLSELQAIAERSAKVADVGGSEADLLDAYEALRIRAEALALEHGWAGSEELGNTLPAARALREIERLDHAFGAESVTAPAPGRDLSDRLTEALNELSSWATGVRLAYETLEDADSDA